MTDTLAQITNADRVTLRKFRDWTRASWVSGSVSNRVCLPLVDRGLLEQRTSPARGTTVLEFRLSELGRQMLEDES